MEVVLCDDHHAIVIRTKSAADVTSVLCGNLCVFAVSSLSPKPCPPLTAAVPRMYLWSDRVPFTPTCYFDTIPPNRAECCQTGVFS